MNEIKIIHIPRIKKFLVRLGRGKYAFIEYEIIGGKIYINKAYTPEEFRGRGIATKIMKSIVKYARDNNMKIVPICSFAKYFFSKYPEFKYVLAK